MSAPHSSTDIPRTVSRQVVQAAVAGCAILLLILIMGLQLILDQRRDPVLSKMEDLAQLPRGEYLKPALLGYHHLGADLLWLRIVQVLGKTSNTDNEYDWLYHGLDVITTLDPQYEYAYKVAGIVMTELANRPDLSNRLLEKGMAAEQKHWYLPYLMAYNYYFYLGDVDKAIEYARLAAQAPGGPPWLVNMVTHMSTQADNPEFALNFLGSMYRQADDPRIKESLESHIKEVIIERDIRLLEPALKRFFDHERRYPNHMAELVTKGYIKALPQEPFGGSYVMEPDTGRVTSSAHRRRLKMYAAPGSEARKR